MFKLPVFFRLIVEGSLFALNALLTNKLRTFLSLLGITIGIFAIISVFTLVDSMERSIRSSFATLGEDAIFIERMPWGPEPDDKEYAWWKYMQRPPVTFTEAAKMRERMTTARAVTFFASAPRTLKYGRNSAERVDVVAASSGFENFISVTIGKGRMFSNSELDGNARVCLLGYEVASRLFGLEEPLGKTIKIGGYRATVIGVLKKEGQSIMGNGTDEWTIIPVTFARSILNVNESNTQLAMKPKSMVSFKAMEDEALVTMRSIRMLRPGEEKNFALNKSSMVSNLLDQSFAFLNIAGLIIGGFSILVGGFSIANIMFVSVRERTGIIGIQKALGAKRGFILFQFLFESVMLCVIGGAIGLILIFITTLVVTGTTGFELVLSLENVLIGLGFSVSIGLISGIVPALMAARMEPVDAIRATG